MDEGTLLRCFLTKNLSGDILCQSAPEPPNSIGFTRALGQPAPLRCLGHTAIGLHVSPVGGAEPSESMDSDLADCISLVFLRLGSDR